MTWIRTLFTASLACAMTFTAQRSFAENGQIRLLCSNGIRAAVQQLMPGAEKAIGRRVVIEFSASTYLKKRIDAGEPFDLVILTPGIIDDLANSGTLAPGSKTDIASSDLAVGIKAGLAKADVSTPDRMKKHNDPCDVDILVREIPFVNISPTFRNSLREITIGAIFGYWRQAVWRFPGSWARAFLAPNVDFRVDHTETYFSPRTHKALFLR